MAGRWIAFLASGFGRALSVGAGLALAAKGDTILISQGTGNARHEAAVRRDRGAERLPATSVDSSSAAGAFDTFADNLTPAAKDDVKNFTNVFRHQFLNP